MRETIICNVCSNPGALIHAGEVASVRSNVRKFGNESFTVWRCPNCRSLHCKEGVDVDRYYVDYPMTKQVMDFGTRKAFSNRLRVMRKHGLKRAHSILDYGCGTGLFATFLKQRGFDVTGFDPYVPEFSDPASLSRTFDFVTTQDVIEHVADPRQLVSEYERLLIKGGTILIGTPNACEIDLAKVEQFSMELHQPYHRHILSEGALTNLCAQSGLKPMGMYRRFYYDTLYPMANTQFIKNYISKTGGYLDAGFEEPKIALVLTSPKLLFSGLFGYFFRAPGNMLGVFQRA